MQREFFDLGKGFSVVADAIGEKLELHIENFEFLGEETLPGVVIRSSNNDSVFSVGCRMPSDHARIEGYVRKKMGL